MIKIFVVCHKPSYVIDNQFMTAIQVGAALTQNKIAGMIADNSGIHISEKNPSYCEVTAQYWAWKNVAADYYGFFHYRRYLTFAHVYPVERDGTLSGRKHPRPCIELDSIHENLDSYGLDERTMEREIQKYDLLTVMRESINTTVYRQYCQYHAPEILQGVLQILHEKYPQYDEAAKAYLGSKKIYYFNMFIMKAELFHEYAGWLFDILETYEERMKNSAISIQKDRMMGYLAERLFGIFYTYQRMQGVRCAEVPYLRFYDTSLEADGGGTESYIRTFRLKPTRITVRVNMRRLNRLFPAGSRRRGLLRGFFIR